MNWEQHFRNFSSSVAICENGRECTYANLLTEIELQRHFLKSTGLKRQSIVLLQAQATCKSIAMFFALSSMECTVALWSTQNSIQKEQTLHLAEIQVEIDLATENPQIHFHPRVPINPLLKPQETSSSGRLVLFSSGSSTEPKVIVHDLKRFFSRFEDSKKRGDRILAFLLFDHIGGLNTVLATLASGSCLIIPPSREVQTILQTIQHEKVTVLPTSPSFLNLVLLYLGQEERGFPSLETITYGTEPMPPSLLRALSVRFPHVRLKQTYGLSEIGIFPTHSPHSTSVFFHLGRGSFQYRIRDGLLELKAPTSMLGYANAPSPYTMDGWLKTGDRAEIHGDQIRIVGRESSLINVGGLKVEPTEIENLLLSLPWVEDVSVAKETNSLLGHIVVAHIKTHLEMGPTEASLKIREAFAGKVEPHKIPQKIVLHREELFNERFKKRNFSKGIT